MDLNTYIKQNQLNPNPALLSQLGASQELIDYLLHTPWNTNFNMIGSIEATESGGGGGDCEVWFTGTFDPDAECDEDGRKYTMLTSTESADVTELMNNYANHSVKVNGVVLPYVNIEEVEGTVFVTFMDAENDHISTSELAVYQAPEEPPMIAVIVPCTEAITNVEVSVCDGSTTRPDTWFINDWKLPKGSPSYPIGRYKLVGNDFVYEGEPTGVADQYEKLVEVYEDTHNLAAKSSWYGCTSWELYREIATSRRFIIILTNDCN